MSTAPTAIITGAGSGIGREVARQLAAAGWRCALVGRSRSTLDETAATIRAGVNASDALVITADMADPAAPRKVVDPVVGAWSRVDALINNAAALQAAPLAATSDGALQHTFAANVFGPARLIAAAWPVFVAQRGGCVVNVSSTAAADPFPGLAIYAASKAALESLTRSIITEGLDHGIRAFNVAPGAVETAMLRRVVSPAQLPSDRTLAPAAVASVIVDCVLGRRDHDIGRTIHLPSP